MLFVTFMFSISNKSFDMSRRTYTAEEIADIIVNLPDNNSNETDIEDDLDESDADFSVETDNLPPAEFENEATEGSENESETEVSEIESETEASEIESSSEEDQPM